MVAVSLPFDIWWKILDYLPLTVSFNLRSLNRIFLEIHRKRNYRNLVIDRYGKSTKRKLAALNAHSLGRYVYSLKIQPCWIVSNVPKFSHGPAARVSSTFDRVHSFFDSEYPKRKAQALVQKRMRKQIKLITEAARNLDSIKEYTLEWDEGPYHDEYFTAFLSNLADPIITPFGQTLTKLSLKVPTNKFRYLVSAKLPALEELHLHLVTKSLLESDINNHLDCLVVFVNNLFQSLRCLSISSTYTSLNLNLHQFFHRLGHFPLLRSLALTIPYDGAHLGSSLDSLRQFISKHSTNIQELKLLCRVRAATRIRPNDPSAKYWIQRILNSIQAPSIQTSAYSPSYNQLRGLRNLELALRPLRSDLQPFLTFLASVADQLESLVLMDDALKPHELGRVLNVLVQRPAQTLGHYGSSLNGYGYTNIRHLSIRLQYLCPYTVDLLASELRSLRSLRLTFSDVRFHHDEDVEQEQVQWTHVDELNFFYDALRTRFYSDWKLSSLKISECPHPRHPKWGKEMEVLFKGCIPSLVLFDVFEPTV
ncbi:hypothetical protein BDP27DRAFT_1292491 [Rhodocollybia butyracea]|uniref:F-box domain-containing protein n=1 Tax=Rhodocollybia butyracea TaxID=206335 RepID=A0A9P5U919_9AGAR|nr:hypothetical protein BDP27DRAFT_1292491 [Rhodocollybia butyracea]